MCLPLLIDFQTCKKTDKIYRIYMCGKDESVFTENIVEIEILNKTGLI